MRERRGLERTSAERGARERPLAEPPTPQWPLLLDTHVWVWYAAGAAGELSRGCVRAIEEARARREVFVSAVSVREVALLVAHRRLALTLPVEEWTRRALGPLGLVPLPLDVTAAARSADLPGRFHRDPADQMLVAQAMVHGLTLVTRDRAILAWARGGRIQTMDASGARKLAGRSAK